MTAARALLVCLGPALLGCSGPDITVAGGGRGADGGGSAVDAGGRVVDGSPPSADGGVDLDASGTRSSEIDLITFNWPRRYGPTSGVDVEDERLWSELARKASVMGLQEAGWIAGWIRKQGWKAYRPDPPGDDDDQPVGNLLVWDAGAWERVESGWYPLSPRTRIQEEAAGPTWHRPKYVVWSRLRRRADGTEWTFGSVHFVPSKHLGGAALELWKQQRDSLLAWWAEQPVRTVVMGDFNAQPGNAVAQPFWEVARRQTAPSHGSRRIDWIVRKRPLTGPKGEALANRDQSDHRPVRGHVRWSAP